MFSSMEPAALLAAMQNPELQADVDQSSAACMQLRVLCREEFNARLAGDLGAADIINYTMLHHKDQPAVQLQGLAVIVNLCVERHRAGTPQRGV